jgi:hypothetical protein
MILSLKRRASNLCGRFSVSFSADSRAADFSYSLARPNKVPRYHGPRDYLDAAESADTPVDELTRLASSDYLFVRLAVAKNPRTPPSSLACVLPAVFESYGEQEIAESVAKRPDTPPSVLERLAGGLRAHLHAGRENRGAFGAAVALCTNEATPFEALRGLLSPEVSKPQFRKVVARETRRRDVLALLLLDVSTTVVARAKVTMSELLAANGDA